MSKLIEDTIKLIIGGVFGFLSSHILQSRSRNFQSKLEYQRELRKHMDDIIKPLFTLLQDLWRSLALINDSIIHEQGLVLPTTRKLFLKDCIEKNERLQDFVSEKRSALALLLPSPFPWIFITLNNLLLSRILSPMLYPEWKEVFDHDLDYEKDCKKALDTITKIQDDLRKLVGYDTDIDIKTKHPL